MFRFIAWSLLAAYLFVVGLWAPAAAPVVLMASGAFTVLAQPAVFLAVLLAGLAVSAWRRSAHKPAPAARH